MQYRPLVAMCFCVGVGGGGGGVERSKALSIFCKILKTGIFKCMPRKKMGKFYPGRILEQYQSWYQTGEILDTVSLYIRGGGGVLHCSLHS